jgi:hypothetical protein
LDRLIFWQKPSLSLWGNYSAPQGEKAKVDAKALVRTLVSALVSQAV